jgi:hypothetical protein
MQGWRTTMEDAIIAEPFLRLPEAKKDQGKAVAEN